MKNILTESNVGDIVYWPKPEIQRVQEPGSDGGQPPAGENPPHWPEPQAPQKPQPPKQKSQPQPPQPGQDKPKDPGEGGDPGEDKDPGEGSGESGDPSDGSGADATITIGDFDDLPEADKEAIRKVLEDMHKKQDTHLEKNTNEDASDSREDRERMKNEIGEIKKKAREREKFKNGGRSLSSEWGRTDEILTMHAGQINWREKLRKFFLPWISKKQEPTFTQVNRRDMTTYRAGTAPSIRPGIRTQAPSPNKLHIFVTVDTSGSVDNDMLASFMSEIQGIFTQTICQQANIEVRVIHWTGGVSGDMLLNSQNFKTYFSNIKRTASGGTNFAAIKQYLIAKKYMPVAMVHFTDADMHFTKDMLFKDNGCKNLIVIPDGFESSIRACRGVFDEVIPMIVYESTKD